MTDNRRTLSQTLTASLIAATPEDNKPKTMDAIAAWLRGYMDAKGVEANA